MGRNDKSTWSLCRCVCSGAVSLGPIDTFRGQGCGTSAIYANDEASIRPCPPPFHNLSFCESYGAAFGNYPAPDRSRRIYGQLLSSLI
jgi:hypothetical protein